MCQCLVGIGISETRQIQECRGPVQRSADASAREGVRQGGRTEQDDLDAGRGSRREQSPLRSTKTVLACALHYSVHVYCIRCFREKRRTENLHTATTVVGTSLQKLTGAP